MKATKDGKTFILHDPAQVEAFRKSGWVIEEGEGAAEQEPPKKKGRAAKKDEDA